jgi:hypothetical protein
MKLVVTGCIMTIRGQVILNNAITITAILRVTRAGRAAARETIISGITAVAAAAMVAVVLTKTASLTRIRISEVNKITFHDSYIWSSFY